MQKLFRKDLTTRIYTQFFLATKYKRHILLPLLYRFPHIIIHIPYICIFVDELLNTKASLSFNMDVEITLEGNFLSRNSSTLCWKGRSFYSRHLNSGKFQISNTRYCQYFQRKQRPGREKSVPGRSESYWSQTLLKSNVEGFKVRSSGMEPQIQCHQYFSPLYFSSSLLLFLGVYHTPPKQIQKQKHFLDSIDLFPKGLFQGK